MGNVFVILNAKEIEPALRLAAGLGNCKVVTHDPHLIDQIRILGFQDVEFFNWENCLRIPGLEKSTNRSVAAMEARLSETSQRFFPELRIKGWQYLALFNVQWMRKWYASLWREFPLRNTDRYNVFVLDNPSILNLKSYLPSVILLELLNASGVQFSAFSYGRESTEGALIPRLVGNHEITNALLIHIPTCVYDFAYFNEEFAATGKPIINLESNHSNVPVLGTTSIGLTDAEELISTLPADLQKRLEDVTSHLSADLSAMIGEFIRTPSYRDRQAQEFAKAYRSQIACYFLLQTYFQQNKPAKIVLSDHDAGIHGPLIAFAQSNRIPVIMLPHAKRINNISYVYENIICLTHPIQGTGVSNGDGKLVPRFNLSYPETFSGTTVFPQKLKNVCMVLNELSCNGVYYTSIDPYLAGIRKISEWCAENSVVLSIRCKPSAPLITSLATITGIEIRALFDAMTVPMAEFVKGKDLCLMYDMPTSGIVDFLRASVPVLNPVPEQLAISESSTVDTNLVPRGSIEDILNQLDLFMADGVNLLKFRNTQFARYVSSFKDSYPLRFFL